MVTERQEFREAVAAVAGTLCFLDAHRHLTTQATCSKGRKRAASVVTLLTLNRSRATAVGGYLLDAAVLSIAKAIQTATLDDQAEFDDGQVLVAGVLYDAETLEEATDGR